MAAVEPEPTAAHGVDFPASVLLHASGEPVAIVPNESS